MMLRFLNLLEPRRDGVHILSISKVWLWVSVFLSTYAVIYSPQDAAAIITSLVGPSGLNYAWRRFVQFKSGGVQ